ncbi:MAG TPA: diheme cytochrome c-553 [Candidatus Eisenbacteria bacterium]|nr:diheme cytochrome c-553 [Candidatus Eisenbacteria bacterium]
MNRTPLLTLAVAGTLGLAALVAGGPMATPQARADHAPAAATKNAQVSRGDYLVKIMGCNDCHTPWAMTDRGPEPDMTRMLSGHPESFAVTMPPDLGKGSWNWAATPTNTAFAGPWGVSFTANLTPDPETGLGKWTPETFIAAIRTGRHEGQGRPILPPMPYPMYRNATDEDLRAVFAYLQSIPPIRNHVPQPLDPPSAQ